jgi:chromosome segregation ATPase
MKKHNKKACSKHKETSFKETLIRIERKLHEVINKENTIMAQIDDLNAAIASEDVEITDILDSIKKVDADIDALIAKVQAGNIPTDLTAQLQAIAAHTTSLTNGAAQLKADDAKANA